MAVDKLVDSSQLNSDLTSVANAIRTKGGTSASLAFPSGFVTAIGNISGGSDGFPGVLYCSSLFNSNYNSGYIYSGDAPTVSAHLMEGVTINCGASRVQKGYVRIGPVDLTNINTIQSVLTHWGTGTGSKNYYSRLYISQNQNDTARDVPSNQLDSYYYLNVSGEHPDSLKGVLRTLDVSGFSGNYYIFTGTDSATSSWSAARIVMVHAIVYSTGSSPYFSTT